MYVTGLRAGDEIYIGENIRIVILSPRNRLVRVGINAPSDLKIKPPTKKPKKLRRDKSKKED